MSLTFEQECYNMKIDPFPGPLTKQPVRHHALGYVLTDEQLAWLCKWFPEEENSRLIAASGMSHSTLHRFARELGLTKSPRGIKRIKKRQAAHIKRLCEQNGYYDSMRGRKMSEACQRGVAKMWQEIREGKREHPARILKRRNPRKYRKWMERKSEIQKEIIRKEMLRAAYGLARQTRIKCIVVYKFTRSQLAHRHNALKRGYILMEDSSEQSGERYNIYYDKETNRAPIFERNLVNDGFSVKEWAW
jgi:hypothetical protein